MHLADAWEWIADELGDAPALIHGTHIRTWQQFDDRAARLATVLLAAGAGPGTTVAIDLYNCSEYFEVFFAALKIRAVPANVNYRYVGAELSQLLTQSRTSVLVYHSSLADRVLPALGQLSDLRTFIEVDDGGRPGQITQALAYEELLINAAPQPRQSRSDRDYFLSYTGGTTGLPKGVMMQIDRTVRSCLQGRIRVVGFDIDPDADLLGLVRRLRGSGRSPVGIPASPLMHSTGFSFASIPTLLAGGSVVTLTRHSFDAVELFETVERRGGTTIGIVGNAFAIPMLRALEVRAATGVPYDLSSIASISSAGVAWGAEVKEALLRHIPDAALWDSCGSTEGAFYGSRVVRGGQAASTANFVANDGVMIVDAERRPLPRGQAGYIASPTPATGYFNDPLATARAFYTVQGVQYVIPGDFGVLEDDGTITLLGRGTSTINTGGEKVFPGEVEDAFRDIPGVDDCLVFGLDDDRFNERVCAIVQSSAEAEMLDESVLLSSARQRLAGYKLPRQVIMAPVPRLPNGKPDYQTAKEMATASPAPLNTAKERDR